MNILMRCRGINLDHDRWSKGSLVLVSVMVRPEENYLQESLFKKLKSIWKQVHRSRFSVDTVMLWGM